MLCLTALLLCACSAKPEKAPKREPAVIPAVLEAHREAIERTLRPVVVIEFEKQDKIASFRSRVGGEAQVPKSQSWPSGKDGKPLRFLCQINFEELPPESGLPARGLLQFFVGSDDVYGCNFEKMDDTSGFAVRYYRELPEGPYWEQPPALEEYDLHPYTGPPRVMHFRQGVSAIPPSHFQFAQTELAPIKKDDRKRDAYLDQFGSNHHLLGYADFTQTDPRAYQELPDDLINFLQLGVEYENGEGLMWGDVGVGHFFISRRDLEKQDFSHFYYHWDCY